MTTDDIPGSNHVDRQAKFSQSSRNRYLHNSVMDLMDIRRYINICASKCNCNCIIIVSYHKIKPKQMSFIHDKYVINYNYTRKHIGIIKRIREAWAQISHINGNTTGESRVTYEYTSILLL